MREGAGARGPGGGQRHPAQVRPPSPAASTACIRPFEVTLSLTTSAETGDQGEGQRDEESLPGGGSGEGPAGGSTGREAPI